MKQTYSLCMTQWVKTILIPVYFFIWQYSSAQVTIIEKNFKSKDTPSVFMLSVKKTEDTKGKTVTSSYIISVKNTEGKESSNLEIKTLNKEIFEAQFKKAVSEVTTTEITDIKILATELFPDVISSALEIQEYEPIAGEIYIHEKIPAYTSDRIDFTENNLYGLNIVPKINFYTIETDRVIAIATENTNYSNKVLLDLDALEKIASTINKEFNENNRMYGSKKQRKEFIDTVKFYVNKFNGRLSTLNNPVKNKLTPLTGYSKIIGEIRSQKKLSLRSNEIKNQINQNQKYISVFHNTLEQANAALSKIIATIQTTQFRTKKATYDERLKAFERLKDTPYYPTEPERSYLSHLKTSIQDSVDNINKYIDTYNKTLDQKVFNNIKTAEVQIEFNEGFIENIKVTGYLEGDSTNNPTKPLVFTNRYPIGFSSKRDFDLLRYTRIFEVSGHNPYPNLQLYLNDIFEYYYNLDLNTRDFSPQNSRLTFLPKDKKPLTRIATSKILEAKVYSDLLGIDPNLPNGLIQTEVSKRINIYTRRWNSLALKRKGGNIGFLNFIEPIATISKVEKNNKRLPIHSTPSIINDQLYNFRCASTLDLRQHQHFSIGTDINWFLWDIPTFKLTFYLNSSGRFGRTALIDTLFRYRSGVIDSRDGIREIGANTIELSPIEVRLKFQSEDRYGISLGNRVNYFNLNNDAIVQIARYADIENSPDDLNYPNLNKGQWYNMFELLGFFNPNRDGNGKLFVRYRFFSQYGKYKTNFSQIQFGYSFYFLSRNTPNKDNTEG